MSGEKPKGPKPCGAKTSRGTACQAPAMENGRCRVHGGATPSGIASPHFKHGRNSKAFKALGVHYREALNDPELLNPKRTIAAQNAIVEKVGDRLEELDSPKFREVAVSKYDALMDAWQEGDASKMGAAIRDLGSHLRRGAHEDQALRSLADQVQKLYKQQIDYWSVAFSARASFSAEEMRMSVRVLLDAMLDEGVSRAQASRIMERWDQVLFDGRLGFAGQAREVTPEP